jgi:plastocyanin
MREESKSMAINVKRTGNRNASANQPSSTRWVVIAAIAAVAFFASYTFAVAQAPQNQVTAAGVISPAVADTGSTGSTGAGSGLAGGGGCCGGGGTKGPAVTKSASIQGGVQTIKVDLSKGYYDPNTIQLKAGVPSEITFGQGSGCLGAVQSQQLGFGEDLSSGPKTIKLGALKPGTYKFACGMGMVSGTIVVK